MNKNLKTTVLALATATLVAGVLFVAPVSAQTVSTTAQLTSSDKLSKIITRSDTAITARLTALNNLSTRLSQAKNLSATEKATFSTEVQTNITGLTSLKAKIDADTDVTTAQADAKTITGSYRIYALIIPQGYIEASADRIDTVSTMLNTISAKLQTRITADQTAGKNVASLQASLADLNAKVADAQTQAQNAQNGVSALVPDQGNATQLASNTAALKASRADTKTGTSDLKTARQDAKTIIAGL
jgi:hypothetical protein